MNYNPTTKKCQAILRRFHPVRILIHLTQKTAMLGIVKPFMRFNIQLAYFQVKKYLGNCIE